MGGTGVGDHADLRTHQRDGVGNFAETGGTQFDDRDTMPGTQLQQRQRRAEVVVQVAAGGQHAVFAVGGTQDAGEHFLDAGLAAGAGDRRHRAIEAVAVQRAEPPKRQTGIRHH